MTEDNTKGTSNPQVDPWGESLEPLPELCHLGELFPGMIIQKMKADTPEGMKWPQVAQAKDAKTAAWLVFVNNRHMILLAEMGQALNELRAAQEENKKLRDLLFRARLGPGCYYDDGELQDNNMPYPIDYKRDSADQIESQWYKRQQKWMEEHPEEMQKILDSFKG